MPQITLPYTDKSQDGRVKILPEQHPLIREVYRDLKSLNKTAKQFNVSKQTILLIVNQESKKRAQERQKKSQYWRIYYTSDKHKGYMQKHRAKKRALGLVANQTKKTKE